MKPGCFPYGFAEENSCAADRLILSYRITCCICFRRECYEDFPVGCQNKNGFRKRFPEAVGF